MPVSNEYVLSSVILPTGQITGIRSQDVSPGLSEAIESGSGEVDPDFAAILSGKPMISFDTTAIASALALVGWDGLPLNDEPVEIYFRKKQNGGTRQSTGVRLTLNYGMIIPKQIQAGHNEIATGSYEIMALSPDGDAAPFSVETDVTVPDIDLLDELFTCGPVSINGTALQAVQKLSVDFGVKASSVGAAGEVFDTFCSIDERSPKIEITGLEMEDFETFGINGVPLTAWLAFLRKIKKGGTREASTNAVHVQFGGSAGLFKPNTAKGGKEKWEADWCIYPTRPDTTTAAIVINTGASIS